VKLVAVPCVQLAPLLVLYSQVAPVSMSVILIVPLLVMLSVANVPVSVCSARLGAVGAVASMVIGLVFWLGVVVVLPARSVCLTLIVPGVYVPSGRLKVVPVPVVQLLPLSVLCCQVALVSMLLTLTVTTLVTPSLLNLPVSWARAMVGAAGEVWSMVMSALFCAGVVVVLPARSVCLIWI